MNEIFRTNEFAIQIISRGSFLDNDPGFRGKVYQVETVTIRLNQIALDEYFNGQVYNCRDDYETKQEYQDYLTEREARRTAFKGKIAAAVGYDPAAGSVAISQAVSEIFTVVHIHEASVPA